MTDAADKPRVRIAAGSMPATDSVQNFLARVGAGTGNQHAATHYGINPITRNRLQLEWAYRGSWICRQVVDAPAEDMTRAGIEIQSANDPKEVEQLQTALRRLAVWRKLKEVAMWARLYGGALGVIMIDGQNPATPLRPETVGKGQFRGLLALDRWAVQPNFTDLVTDFGPDYGLPATYSVTASYANLPRIKVHHSRVIRMEGEDLPIWQKSTENGWGLSVLEPMWDRLTAFDSTTVGTAQLVYKAHLRILKIKGLRDLLAAGGRAEAAIAKNVDLIRSMQTNEGLTLLDSEDEFATQQYGFGGLSDVLIQFAQQLAGATQIPLTRLFGQAPAGLSATGDADIRNYYDAILSQQEAKLRNPFDTLLRVLHWSELGKAPPEGFTFTFRSLWQMSAKERSEIATAVVGAVIQAEGAALINRATALKELRQTSAETGLFTNITDQDIADAEAEPPAPGEVDPPEPAGPMVEPDPQTEEAEAEPSPAEGTRDAGFEEEDHPRAENGQFGKGRSGSGGKAGAETKGAGHASKLYEAHVKNAPATEEGRKKRGAEIAEEVGATKQVEAARQKLAGGTSTDVHVSKGGHRQDDGSYTRERRKLHDSLLDQVFTPEAIKAATPAPGAKPVMTMLGGRGGSGKSWLTGKDGPVDATKAVVVDADHFKGRLPEYQGWNAGLLHEESSHLVDRAAEIAEKLGLNVVFDATMKSAKGAEDRIRQFETAGHDVHGYYMFASPETATKRAMGRFVRGGEKGRFVPPEVVMSNTDNEKNFDRATPRFKKWGIYDNNDGGGGAPRHVASGENR